MIPPIHPFPARMAPEIALNLISESNEPLRILDPMMGSGTVPAVARLRGHRAIGVDIDPLAVLIAKVWTTAIDPDELRRTAILVLERAKQHFTELLTRDAYPSFADDETRVFIRYWFDPYARRQLHSLAQAITESSDGGVQDALWCAFSRLIITKQSGASLAMDLSHSRPHKKYSSAPTKPFNKFISAVEIVAKNCVDKRVSNRGPAPSIKKGDARALDLRDGSVDLVLTSPPYLNAIDYIRCSKFSLVWMGHSIGQLRDIRKISVGAETSKPISNDCEEIEDIIAQLNLSPALPSLQTGILTRYVEDMRRSICEAARVLKSGGKAVYVVGENTIKGTFIPNADMVSKIAENAGLKLSERTERTLPANRRYLPPPSSSSTALKARMRKEIILAFEKM